MKMLLLEVKRDGDTAYLTPRIVSVKSGEHELEQFYGLLDCDTIDIVTDTINGKEFDLIVDDEGLLTQREPSYLTSDGRVLVGNILFCHNDGNGATTGIDKEDVDLLSVQLALNAEKLNSYFQRLRAKRDVRRDA